MVGAGVEAGARNGVVVVVEPNVKTLSTTVMAIVIQQKTIIFSQMMALPVTRYYYTICTGTACAVGFLNGGRV